MANVGKLSVINALPVPIQHVSTVDIAECALTKADETKYTRIFDHNIGLMQDLMEKDFRYGRIFIIPNVQQTTAEQIVNLLSRSKQRRRKQIFDERIGKVRSNIGFCYVLIPS